MNTCVLPCLFRSRSTRFPAMLQSMLVQWHPNGPKFHGNNGELSETTEMFQGPFNYPLPIVEVWNLMQICIYIVICVWFPLYISALFGLVSYNDPPCFFLARTYIKLWEEHDMLRRTRKHRESPMDSILENVLKAFSRWWIQICVFKPYLWGSDSQTWRRGWFNLKPGSEASDSCQKKTPTNR